MAASISTLINDLLVAKSTKPQGAVRSRGREIVFASPEPATSSRNGTYLIAAARQSGPAGHGGGQHSSGVAFAWVPKADVKT